MKIIAKIVALSLVALTVALPASAQETPPAAGPAYQPPVVPQEGTSRTPGAALVAMDTNGDASIDKAEWTAAGRRDRGFTMLDANKDGKLTTAEIKAVMAKFRSRRAR